MESLSRPPHRRKRSTSTNASSSSFSLKTPYDDVLLSRGSKSKFEPREYAEIFSGSSSIPVLDLSGLSEPVRPAGCRSSQLDYSNIFGGERDDDVAVSYEQLFNGVPKKTKSRISADAESPLQEHGSVNSSGEAKRVNGVSDDGITQKLNMSFNKTNQTSNEPNGNTHIAQLHAVSGFNHFVDGTPQLQKKGGERPVVSMQRDVSRTWSFKSGVGATTVEGGSSPDKSYRPDNSCSVNGINSESDFAKVQPTSGHLSGSNDNKDIKHSSLPYFAHEDASKEAAHSPPLSDEELDENSDAAVSIAALKKAIEQAQESIRLARMIVQKKREGVKNGSRARKPKDRSKVDDKKEDIIEHASGCLKESNDPTFSMFTGVVEKSAPILNHSGKHVNARKAKVETVRENFEAASDHESAFIEVDKKFAPSSSRSGSHSTDKNVEVGNIRENVGAFEPHGERINFTGSVETVVSESGRKVDCNDNLRCSKAKAVRCLEHLETDDKTLEQRESILHQQEVREDFSGRPENVVNTSRSVQELEQIPNENAVEQCQVTVSPIKGHADLGEQLERVLGVSRSMQEQEKNTHGHRHLRISKENEPPGYTDSIDDEESCEEKFVGHEELYLDQHLTMPRSNLNTLQNESPRLAEKNMVDLADIDKQLEDVSEWKEDVQDRKCSDANENGKAAREEILWIESELQLEESVEEEISEREPETVPEIGEAPIKVNMFLEPKIDDEKLNFELENDSQTVPGEHEENEIALRCMNTVETIQIVENNDSEVQDGEISLDGEELNDTDEVADGRKKLQDNFEESNDSASEKDSSESFVVHSDDPDILFRDNQCINTRTIFNETLEPCNDDLTNKAEKYQAVRRGCEENNSLPQESEIQLTVEDNETGEEFDVELSNVPGSDAEKFTESQLNNSFEGFRDSKFTSIALMNAGGEKTLPDDEDKFKRTNEFHNAAEEDAANTSPQNFPELHVSTDDQVNQCDTTNVKQGLLQTLENGEDSQSSSTLESIYEVSSAHESPACRDDSSDKEELKGQQSERLNTEDQSHLSQTNCKPKEMYKSVEAERDIKTGQNTEKNMQNLSRASTSEQQDVKGNEQKGEMDDHLQRIEAIKKGREREKDRIAVERVIREARERAFADARERAERASVERAAAEARQRVMAETLKKAPVETKPSAASKASIEAKLRAERAAVERATTEARERALEKAMSQKNSIGARASSSSSNIELKHSLSSSDSEKVDTSRESAQRRKARLERHQRIMERAAKALAEKSMRDLLAQKEQAERSRLAESLDDDVKRWATGKEGNLRALLSTLQYILGPESGWQPIPLTEIVTSAAVKKSYRKATLCVHPDKLQQRGASVQQKYICEKIFDLLKAAWNRFNSEEN